MKKIITIIMLFITALIYGGGVGDGKKFSGNVLKIPVGAGGKDTIAISGVVNKVGGHSGYLLVSKNDSFLLEADTGIAYINSNRPLDFRTGNIGINTATPTKTLDVNGAMRVRTLRNSLYLDSTVISDTSGTLHLAKNIYWKTNGNGGTDASVNFLGTTDGQPLLIKTNNTPAVFVDVNQNIGIGTSSPQATLQVEGGVHINMSNNSTYPYSTLKYKDNNTGDSTLLTEYQDGLHWEYTGVGSSRLTQLDITDGGLQYSINNEASEPFRIDNVTGNVGIGVTGAASAKLQVAGSFLDTVKLQNGNSLSLATIGNYGGSGAGGLFITYGSNPAAPIGNLLMGNLAPFGLTDNLIALRMGSTELDINTDSFYVHGTDKIKLNSNSSTSLTSSKIHLEGSNQCAVDITDSLVLKTNYLKNIRFNAANYLYTTGTIYNNTLAGNSTINNNEVKSSTASIHDNTLTSVTSPSGRIPGIQFNELFDNSYIDNNNLSGAGACIWDVRTGENCEINYNVISGEDALIDNISQTLYDYISNDTLGGFQAAIKGVRQWGNSTIGNVNIPSNYSILKTVTQVNSAISNVYLPTDSTTVENIYQFNSNLTNVGGSIHGLFQFGSNLNLSGAGTPSNNIAVFGGNVGIGTSTLPAYTLDLIGNAHFSQQLYFGTGGQNISQGSFDNGTGGNQGISLKCAVGYELNWQGGKLSNHTGGSYVPVVIDSGLNVNGTLKVVDGTQGTGKVLTSDANGNASWQSSTGGGWGLTGNSGTTVGTNFIGTTDAQDLRFKVNNNATLQLFQNEHASIGSALTDSAWLSINIGSHHDGYHGIWAYNTQYGYPIFTVEEKGNTVIAAHADYTGHPYALDVAQYGNNSNSGGGLRVSQSVNNGNPLAVFEGYGNVGIGTTTPAGVLDVTSTTSGIIFPRVASDTAVTSPIEGMVIYSLSLGKLELYSNAGGTLHWEVITSL